MTTEFDKKVSIIIPCFNKGKYVEESIQSALNQTYLNTEIIVIDDASTDNSAEIIKTIAEKNPKIIFVQNKENKGVIYTRNKAIEIAQGDYILPFDADDIIDSSYVEKAVKIINNNNKIGWVYPEVKFIGNKKQNWIMPEFNENDFLYGKHNIICSALFRKSDFIKLGGYKEDMVHGNEDWDLWLSFYENGLKPYKIQEVLYSYRQYDEDSRQKNCVQHQKDMHKLLLQHHFNLYLNNNEFTQRVFKPHLYNEDLLNIERKKKRKYKKLYNILLIVCIIQLIVIIALLVTKGIFQ